MKKIYMCIENGYVTDNTEINPYRPNYPEYHVASYPLDIMCGCYKFINGVFVLDEQKYEQFLMESEEANNDVDN